MASDLLRLIFEITGQSQGGQEALRELRTAAQRELTTINGLIESLNSNIARSTQQTTATTQANLRARGNAYDRFYATIAAGEQAFVAGQINAAEKASAGIITAYIKAGQQANAALKKQRDEAEANAPSSAFSGAAIGAFLGSSVTTLGMRALSELNALLREGISAWITYASKVQTASIAFEVMTGSVSLAQTHLEALRDFAIKTPFQFEELIDASQKMQALGYSTEQVIPLLNDIGNAVAAAGGGADRFERVVKAMSDVRARGILQAQEIRQFAEAGVPAYRILSEQLNLTTAEIMKLTAQGQISAGMWEDAFRKYSQMHFGDLMKKQSETFQGAMSNMEDLIKFFAAEALAPIFEVLNKVGDATQKALTNVRDQLKAGTIDINTALQQGLKIISDNAVSTAIQIGNNIAAAIIKSIVDTITDPSKWGPALNQITRFVFVRLAAEWVFTTTKEISDKLAKYIFGEGITGVDPGALSKVVKGQTVIGEDTSTTYIPLTAKLVKRPAGITPETVTALQKAADDASRAAQESIRETERQVALGRKSGADALIETLGNLHTEFVAKREAQIAGLQLHKEELQRLEEAEDQNAQIAEQRRNKQTEIAADEKAILDAKSAYASKVRDLENKQEIAAAAEKEKRSKADLAQVQKDGELEIALTQARIDAEVISWQEGLAHIESTEITMLHASRDRLRAALAEAQATKKSAAVEALQVEIKLAETAQKELFLKQDARQREYKKKQDAETVASIKRGLDYEDSVRALEAAKEADWVKRGLELKSTAIQHEMEADEEAYRQRAAAIDQELALATTSNERKAALTNERLILDNEYTAKSKKNSAERTEELQKENEQLEENIRNARLLALPEPPPEIRRPEESPIGVFEDKLKAAQATGETTAVTFGKFSKVLTQREIGAATAGLKTLEDAFSGVASAVGDTVYALVLYGTASKSLRQVTAEILAQVAAQASAKSVFEFAEGLAALALAALGMPEYAGSAAFHFGSSAAYAAVAGITGGMGRAVAGGAFAQGGAAGRGAGTAAGTAGQIARTEEEEKEPTLYKMGRNVIVEHIVTINAQPGFIANETVKALDRNHPELTQRIQRAAGAKG